ncbi:hypothetical protein BGX38DRAFT_1258420 [Terfezia claveryi]|nr:hypothetical protein BGX38DRAFT_1258420 [Terfezia claveryi]
MSRELEVHGSAGVEELAPTVVEVDEKKVEVVEEKVEEVLEAQESKKFKWQPWQDHLLAKQVLAEDPFGSVRGQTMKSWEAISDALALIKLVGIMRSGIACKSRCGALIKAHKAENLLSLKKTGTDEEVFNYTRDMDEILIRSEQQAHDPAIKAEAKHKLEKLKDDGKKIRDEAMRGQAKLDSVGKEKVLQDLLE